MTKSETVKLIDVCKSIFAGGDVPKDNYSLEQDDFYSVPIYTNGEQNLGLYGYTTKARVEEPSITVSARGTIGFTAIRTKPFYPAIRLITLTPNERIDIQYLYYVTKNYKFDNGGTSIPQLTVPMLKNYSFPLPDLETQRKIASNLDKVTHTIDLCNAILEKLDMLVKSRFVEMFGDPVYNTNSLPVKCLGDLGEWASGGTPSRAINEYFDGSINWYSAGELNSLFLEGSIEKITEEAILNSSAKLFKAGSMLVGMYDTAAFKMGILKEDSASNQACACITPNNSVNIIWLYYELQMMKNHFLSQRRGVRQKNLNLGMIRSFEIPIADIKKQYEFAAFVEQTDKSKSAVKKLLEKAETLKKALMQEYFG